MSFGWDVLRLGCPCPPAPARAAVCEHGRIATSPGDPCPRARDRCAGVRAMWRAPGRRKVRSADSLASPRQRTDPERAPPRARKPPRTPVSSSARARTTRHDLWWWDAGLARSAVRRGRTPDTSTSGCGDRYSRPGGRLRRGPGGRQCRLTVTGTCCPAGVLAAWCAGADPPRFGRSSILPAPADSLLGLASPKGPVSLAPSPSSLRGGVTPRVHRHAVAVLVTLVREPPRSAKSPPPLSPRLRSARLLRFLPGTRASGPVLPVADFTPGG